MSEPNTDFGVLMEFQMKIYRLTKQCSCNYLNWLLLKFQSQSLELRFQSQSKWSWNVFLLGLYNWRVICYIFLHFSWLPNRELRDHWSVLPGVAVCWGYIDNICDSGWCWKADSEIRESNCSRWKLLLGETNLWNHEVN